MRGGGGSFDGGVFGWSLVGELYALHRFTTLKLKGVYHLCLFLYFRRAISIS